MTRLICCTLALALAACSPDSRTPQPDKLEYPATATVDLSVTRAYRVDPADDEA